MNQYEIELRDKVALTAYESMCRENGGKISGFTPQEQMVVFAYDSARLFMIEREKRLQAIAKANYYRAIGDKEPKE